MTEQKLRGASVLLHAIPQAQADSEQAQATQDQVALLEHRLALLHGTEAALCLSSKLGVLGLLVSELLVAGDNLVCADQLCGETYSYLDVTCARTGFDVRFVSEPWDISPWEEAIDERTQFLFVECPSDPNLFVPDLEALSGLARDHCLPLVVDTTVSTPVLCPAMKWGVELVITSLAGDLSGMSGCAGGAVMGAAERLRDLRKTARRVPGWPLSQTQASLVLLGLETLMDRLQTKRENTAAVRSFLLERRADREVTFVDHPSLRKHPQYELARKTFNGFAGSLISFGLRGGQQAAEKFMSGLRLIKPATHPGSNRTTIAHPFVSTHVGLTEKQKSQAVILPQVLRLCVGNEDAADILRDLERGFAAI